jgi:heptose I phosphotransferase
VGWSEVFKNLLQLRLPVTSAINEYRAAITLTKLGIETLNPKAFGLRGKNPAKLESFLVTEDIVDSVSLEDLTASWRNSAPRFAGKKNLVEKLAGIARTLHENGMNHRDFYLCHFLIKKSDLGALQKGGPFACFLIDLHRTQFHSTVPRRWLIKDLAGLYYSALDAGITRHDVFRFIKIYTGQPLADALKNPDWAIIAGKAHALYQKDFGHPPEDAPF